MFLSSLYTIVIKYLMMAMMMITEQIQTLPNNRFVSLLCVYCLFCLPIAWWIKILIKSKYTVLYCTERVNHTAWLRYSEVPRERQTTTVKGQSAWGTSLHVRVRVNLGDRSQFKRHWKRCDRILWRYVIRRRLSLSARAMNRPDK